MTCFLFLIVIFVSYMVFFNHGAPESIMAENRGKRPSVRMFVDKDSHKNELDKELEEEERKALEHWEQFIKDHDYTAIGEIYDNCGEYFIKINNIQHTCISKTYFSVVIKQMSAVSMLH